MSQSNLIRLSLFRLLALGIMLALIAGSFSAYRETPHENTVLESPEPTPEATPEPTPVSRPPIPLNAVPPASHSDLDPVEPIEPAAPVFRAADGSSLSYAWGESVPAGAQADDTWFADAAFIGNSLCDGLMLFGTISEADFYCAKSITVQNIYTEKCINAGGGEYISITDALEREQYKKIFIMLGINEIFRDSDWFYGYYAALIDHLRETEPDAEIYLQSILPVTEQKSNSGYYNKANVLRCNEQIVKLCKEKSTFYIDVYSHIADSEGYLPAEASSDGVHLTRAYYRVWSDYLKSHTITEVTE